MQVIKKSKLQKNLKYLGPTSGIFFFVSYPARVSAFPVCRKWIKNFSVLPLCYKHAYEDAQKKNHMAVTIFISK